MKGFILECRECGSKSIKTSYTRIDDIDWIQFECRGCGNIRNKRDNRWI
jgi:ribosomal protein L44E